MALRTIPFGAKADDIEQGLLLGSTIYYHDEDSALGDVVGHVDYHRNTKRFVYHLYGKCNYKASNTTKYEDCTVWYEEPKTFEFARFIDLAVHLAFVGKEWS